MAVTKIINSEEKQYKPVLIDKLVLDTVPTAGSFNGVTSDGVAKAISGSGNVPTPAAGDNGKVLTADNGSYAWAEPTGVEYYAGEGITISDENAISITETIRNGATAGATAVQPHDLASVATTGDYDDLSNKPTIPAAQVNADWEANSGVAQILNKPTLAAVATSGSYSDLSNKPNIPAAQVNADWNADSGVAAILNKPNMSNYAEKANLATVATTGSYTDLSNKPTIPAAQVQSNWAETDSTSKAYIQNKPDMTAYAQTANLATVATTGSYTDLSNKPALATVATSGSYADLSNKPSIPAAQVNADWDAVSGVEQILNKPNLATVATTGSYDDLTNKPTIPSAVTVDQHFDAQSSNAQSGTAVAEAIAGTGQVPTVTSADDNKVLMASYEGGVGSFSWEPSAAATQVNADWDATSGVAKILNKPDLSVYAQSSSLATVATSGNYNDLSNRPSIPAAQVNADWDAASGVAQILNKPTFATVATSGDYDDLTNKPTIPAAQVQANWNESDNTSKAYIQNKPDLTAYAVAANLATVATTGDYDDLTNKPTIPAAQVQSNWSETSTSSKAYIQNKPDLSVYAQSANLATVATSGSYNDLSDKPSIPAAVTVDQVYSASSTNAQSGVAVASAVAGKQDTINDLAAIRSGAEAGATAVQPGSLATVATTGSYADLSNKPSIPAAQVNSDWNAVSGVTQILNKPNLATVATTGSYSDLSNKPTIPTVDQNYNAASANAQSGVAVAGAIDGAVDVDTDNVVLTGDGDSIKVEFTRKTRSSSESQAADAVADASTTYCNAIYFDLDAFDSSVGSGFEPKFQIKQTIWLIMYANAYIGFTDTIPGSTPSTTGFIQIGSYGDSISAQTVDLLSSFPTIATQRPGRYFALILPTSRFSNEDVAANPGNYAALTGWPKSVTVTEEYTDIPNIPASTSADENKVLTVNSSGSAVWAAAQGGTVDQTYNSASTNAQSGTAVAQAISGINAVPASTSADQDKVLTVNSSGTPVWAEAQGGGGSGAPQKVSLEDNDFWESYLRATMGSDTSNGIFLAYFYDNTYDPSTVTAITDVYTVSQVTDFDANIWLFKYAASDSSPFSIVDVNSVITSNYRILALAYSKYGHSYKADMTIIGGNSFSPVYCTKIGNIFPNPNTTAYTVPTSTRADVYVNKCEKTEEIGTVDLSGYVAPNNSAITIRFVTPGSTGNVLRKVEKIVLAYSNKGRINFSSAFRSTRLVTAPPIVSSSNRTEPVILKGSDCSYAFYACGSLVECNWILDLTAWKFNVYLSGSNYITDCSYMFNDCRMLKKAPVLRCTDIVRSVAASSATYYIGDVNLSHMFFQCYSLNKIEVYNVLGVSAIASTETISGLNLDYVFYKTALTEYPGFLVNTESGVKTAEALATSSTSEFEGCSFLKTVPTAGWSVTFKPHGNMQNMFKNAYQIENSDKLYTELSASVDSSTVTTGLFTNTGSMAEDYATKSAQIPSSWGGTGA
jgi:hypothetical protein